MKKLTFILFIIFIFISSCKKEQSGIVLRLQDWQLAEEPAGSSLNEMIESFNESHQGLSISGEGVPFAQALERFTVQDRGNDAPDILRVSAENITKLYELGSLEDMTVFTEKEDSDFLNPFYENALDWATIEGRLYGMPNRIDAQALFYNKSLYEEAGILNPPKTWKELEEISVLLTKDLDNDGVFDQYGYQILGARTGSLTGRLSRWIWDNGGSIISEDLSHATINSTESKEALEFWAGLNQKGVVPPGVLNADFQTATNNFSQGVVAQWQSGPWSVAQIIEKNPEMEGKIGIAPLPNNGISQGGATYYVISSKSEFKEEAWEFVKYMTSLENQTKWTLDTKLLPARKDAAAQPEIQNDPYLVHFFDSLGSARPFPQVGSWDEISETIWDLAQDALGEKKTTEEILVDAETKINEILNRD